MIVLKNTATGDNLAGKQDAGTDVNCHVSGAIVSTTTGLISGSLNKAAALSTTATSITGTPGANTMFVVGAIKITNTGASIRTVTLYLTDNSVTYAAGNQWGATIVLGANESAEWDGQWITYNSAGDVVVTQDYSLYSAKGTILAASAAGVPASLAVGSDNKFLKADSSQASGLLWDELMPSVHTTPAQALASGDTYVTGSAINVPANPRVGRRFRWRVFVSKTAAGTAAPIWIARFGTAGTIADTARCTMTMQAQTAVVDQGVFDVEVEITTAGASGIAVMLITCAHRLGTTGLSIGDGGDTPIASSAFDLTVANLKVGVSVNVGTSGAWTVNRLITETMN